MKDKVRIETAEDGHKVVYHSKPLSENQKRRLIHKLGGNMANSMQMPYDERKEKKHKRVTNYWQRRGDLLNLPVALYLVIIAITCLLIVGAIFSI